MRQEGCGYVTRDDSGLLECLLAVLIRRAGGSVTLTRAELDAAVDASATPEGRSEWLFDYDPSPDGTQVTVRAVAAPLRARQATGPADVPVGGVAIPMDRFAGAVLAALIHQDGGSVEVQIDSYQKMTRLLQAGPPLTLRPVADPDGGDHFTVELAHPDPETGPAQRSHTLPPPR